MPHPPLWTILSPASPSYLCRILLIFLLFLAIHTAFLSSPPFTYLETFQEIESALSSGRPALVLCVSPGEALPAQFEKVVSKGLKYSTKTFTMECKRRGGFESGESVVQRLKLDVKKQPLGFVMAGGKHVQLDWKKGDPNEFVNAFVGNRFKIDGRVDDRQIRDRCDKRKCVIWGKSVEYFGIKSAVRNPNWWHFRAPDVATAVGGRTIKRVVITWTDQDHFLGLFVDSESYFKDVNAALKAIEEDSSFAASKAIVLSGKKWIVAGPVKKAEPRQQSSKKESRETKRKDEPRKRQEDVLQHERYDDEEEYEGLDLDEL